MLDARAPSKYAVLLLLAVGSGAWTVGCGGSHSGAEDPARLAAQANQQLQGTWILTSFQPRVGLEPMLAQLLGMQMGRLTARFDGARVSVSGIGVQASRAYQVQSAAPDRFHMTLS